MKAVNIKEKLANARETCRGYSGYTYHFVDYIAENLTGPVVPEGLGQAVSLCLAEIQSGRDMGGNELPEYFVTNKNKILDVAWQLLQVIDVVADGEFAEEFREFCAKAFGWDALKRITVDDSNDYPEYVKVALDWWTGAIQAGREYTETNGERHKTSYKQPTEKDILVFRKILGRIIMKWMAKDGLLCLVIDTGTVRTPLSKALRKIGLVDNDGKLIMPHQSVLRFKHIAMQLWGNSIVVWDGVDGPTCIWREDED